MGEWGSKAGREKVAHIGYIIGKITELGNWDSTPLGGSGR